MKTYIDLSQPINNHMPAFPGDEQVELDQISSFADKGHTDFRLKTAMHAGTHIDGPMHMTQSRQFIGDFYIDSCIGTGFLLNAAGEKNITIKSEYESRITPDSIVVVYTGFERKYGTEEYYNDHPVITAELANLFIAKRIKMVCMDLPSPDHPPYTVHSLLLKNNVLIAENLTNLEQFTPVKKFEVIALPLRILADSSPARIIAKIIE